jgi:hypothetical protein
VVEKPIKPEHLAAALESVLIAPKAPLEATG